MSTFQANNMNRLPPELKLQILFSAAHKSDSSLCSLASTTRLFYLAFKHHEYALINSWLAHVDPQYAPLLKLLASPPKLFESPSVIELLEARPATHPAGTIGSLRQAMRIDRVVRAAAKSVAGRYGHVERTQWERTQWHILREPEAWVGVLYYKVCESMRGLDLLSMEQYSAWEQELGMQISELGMWIAQDQRQQSMLGLVNRGDEDEVVTRAGLPALKPDKNRGPAFDAYGSEDSADSEASLVV